MRDGGQGVVHQQLPALHTMIRQFLGWGSRQSISEIEREEKEWRNEVCGGRRRIFEPVKCYAMLTY